MSKRAWLLLLTGALFSAQTVLPTNVTPARAVGEPLSGIVTDTAGTPLEGVRVSVSGSMIGISALTAADGSYALSPPDGTYQLEFNKAGFRGEIYDEVTYPPSGGPAPTGLPVVIRAASPQVINENLMRLPRLTGVVRDGASNPLGVGISASQVPFGAGFGTVSAPDGTFAIDLNQPGTYRVSGFSGSFINTYAPSTAIQNTAAQFTVGFDQSVDIGQLTMLLGGSIAGVVSSNSGPLAGVNVNVNAFPPVGGAGMATTAADGTYTIGRLPAGTYQVNFSKTGYLGSTYNNLPNNTMSPTPVSVSEAGTTSGINAVLNTGANVSGRVLDNLGNPVSGATVKAAQQGGGFSPTTASATTAADGTYTLAGVPGGSYLLSATATGFATVFASGAVVPSAADVLALTNDTTTTANFSLLLLGNVTGRVLQPNGQPLVGANVTATLIYAGGLQWFPSPFNQFQQTTTTDAGGYFTISGIAPGQARVVASPVEQNGPLAFEWYQDAYREGDATPVAIPAGATTAPVVISLAVGGVIRGRVTDATGNPVVGTGVDAMTADGRGGGFTVTDANGNYVINGVPPDSYRVVANPINDSPQTYYPNVTDYTLAPFILVGLGEVHTGIDIQMPATARMEATILDAAGNPISGVFWGVIFCSSPGVPVASFAQCSGGVLGGATTITKPTPTTWVGRGITPGTYNVAALSAFPIAISNSIPLTLASGDVASCTFRISGAASCTVTHGTPEPDSDGVTAAVESGVNAAGDGNGDGTPDSQQSNVTSIPSPVSGGGYITVATPPGTQLSSVTVADPATVSAPPPPGATLETGVIAYTVNGVTPGSTVDIDVYLTTDTANGYVKLQGGQWLPLSSAAFTKVSDTHFVLHLKDGGEGDEDGVTNGVIVDPGAPALLDLTKPTVSVNGITNGATYTLGAVPTPSCTASDLQSGLAGPCTGQISGGNGNGLGVFIYTATATDRAGNVGTSSATYTVISDRQVIAAMITQLSAQTLVGNAATSRGKAVVSLNNALTLSWWTSAGIAPIAKNGSKIFDEIHNAVQELAKISGNTTVSKVYSNLLAMTRKWAAAAIDAATARGASQNTISQARQQLLLGDTKATQNNPGDAVDAYRQAWSKATN